MNWKGKKILVVGCGISGIGSTELLEKVGASPILFDENTNVNIDNVKAHYLYTGKEIYQQMEGKIDYLVAGIGTGGTISGIGKYLKEQDDNIKIIGLEPSKSAVISKKEKGSHKIYGIGAGFVPTILNKDIIDEIYLVDEKDAYDTMKLFMKHEGIFVGVSSGAALNVAYRLQEKYGFNKRIICILPDSGNRYLSILN